MTAKRKLTAKQERFIEEYLVDMNATQAAIRAGYSEKTANRMGPENLSKPVISEAVQRARAELSEKTQITQERVLEEEACIAFANLADLFDGSGKLVNPKELPFKLQKALSSIQVIDLPDGTRKYKYTLWHKGRALERVSKHLGMYIERKEVTGKDGGPIEHGSSVKGLMNLKALEDAIKRNQET